MTDMAIIEQRAEAAAAYARRRVLAAYSLDTAPWIASGLVHQHRDFRAGDILVNLYGRATVVRWPILT